MADLTKTVKLKVLADDGDAEAKLDSITAKADKLRAEHPELSIRIDTAEATAKMAVFRDELKAATRPVTAEVKVKVNDRSLVESKAKLSIFAKLAGGVAGGGSGGGGLFGPLASDGLGPLPALLTSPVGLGVLVASASALVVEITGVVSGLTAAGAGVGGFAALAIPTLDKIKNAYTGISAAQTTYNNAVALNKADPTKANAAAAALALVKLKIAQDSVSPSTRKAISGIDQLKTSYEKMATAFAPQVIKVFNDGLKIANNLLPTLKPFADTAATAIDGLLTKLGKFTQSKGFEQWLGQFQKLAGPAIMAIGQGIGRVTSNFGKLLTTMSAKDVVHALNIAFDLLSGSIKGLTFFVREAMTQWDNLDNIWHKVMSVASQLSLDLGNVMIRIGHDVSNWASNVGHAVGVAVTWFKGLPGRIVGALANLPGLLFTAGKNAVQGLINGLKSLPVVGPVISWGSSIVSNFASKLGIHSPSAVMFGLGQNVAKGLELGIRAGTGGVGASSLAMANAVGLTGGGSGRGALQITMKADGGDSKLMQAFMDSLRFEVRQTGGGGPTSVQRAIGQVV